MIKRINKFVYNLRKDSLFTNSFYLMLSSFIMTGLGFFFWMINARLFTSEDIGLATTIISVMGLITAISGLGMGVALIRFLPGSKRKEKKINSCFTIVAVFTIIVTTVFLLGMNIFASKIIFIKKNIFLAIAFIFFMVILSLFALIENVFIAHKQTKYVFYKNTLFSLLKLGFVFLFVFLGAYGIFLSWTIAAAIALLFASAILIVKHKHKFRAVIYDDIVKHIVRFSFANYIAGILSTSQNLLLPILITHYLTPTDTAYFYIATMMAGLLFIIPQAISSSLFAQTAAKPKLMKQTVKKSILYISMILIPGIVFMILFGKPLLSFFGKEYVSNSYEILVILVFSSIFIAIKAIYTTILNIRKEIKKIIIINGINTLVIIALSITITHYGLKGFALSYLIGQAMILPLIKILR